MISDEIMECRKSGNLAETKSVVQYFEALGYVVSWDRDSNGAWFELLKKGKMFAQIEMGIPLSDIIEDLICWHLKKPTTSKSDWTLSGPNSATLSEMLRKVYEKERGQVSTHS